MGKASSAEQSIKFSFKQGRPKGPKFQDQRKWAARVRVGGAECLTGPRAGDLVGLGTICRMVCGRVRGLLKKN